MCTYTTFNGQGRTHRNCFRLSLILFTGLLYGAYKREDALARASSLRLINQDGLLSTNSDFAYVTLYTDDEHYPALQVFLSSLHMTRPKYTLFIAASLNIDSRRLRNAVDKLYPRPVVIEVWNQSRVGFSYDMLQLRVWDLVQYKRVIYVDVDVLFLNNVDSFLNHAVDQGLCASWQELGTGKTYLDSGVMLVEPSTRTFQALTAVQAMHASAATLLNSFFRHCSCRLPPVLNAQVALGHPSLPPEHEIFILHFTAEKPWRRWSTKRFRERWIQPQFPSIVYGLDVDVFDHEHRLWKEVFLRLLQLDKHLRFWQMYHSKRCWAKLESDSLFRRIRLSGPMSGPDDFDAEVFEARLSNPLFQASFGEFAGLMALYKYKVRLRERPFIGFTSWRWKDKQDWMEGASIDWTKVDFVGRKVYYWYAIYMSDFFDCIDIQHPGMRRVFSIVLDGKLPALGAGYYAMSNYFIMHVSLFESFMQFAMPVVDAYLTLYPLTSKCPFSTPHNQENRCGGFFAERLLHVWAASLEDVQMVYAVDNPEWRRMYGIAARSSSTGKNRSN